MSEDDASRGQGETRRSASIAPVVANRQLESAQRITHLGSWEWDARTNAVTWSDELYRIYGLEPRSVAISFDAFISRVHPDDRARTIREVRAALESGGRFAYPERILRPDGSVRELETMGEAARAESGEVIGLIGTCRDVTNERARDEQIRLYADLVRNAQIGMSVWRVDAPEEPKSIKLVAFNPAAEGVARMPLGPWVGKSLGEIAPYAQGGELERILVGVATDGQVREAQVLASRSQTNPSRALAMKAFPISGGRVGASIEDITGEVRVRGLRDGEQKILEMIARGHALPEILEAITLFVESFAPPALASILLLDEGGLHVRHGAAPHLPASYIAAIDGTPIGPKEGSCGTAAFTGQPAIVTDIETDPLWDGYRELARAAGLRACWSTPIFSRDRRVLGTFALYYQEPRAPRDEDRTLIARATDVAGIAIDRRQLETQLRELSAHVERAREEERTGIAREIHDVLGQALTALKMDLAWIARRASAGELPKNELLGKVATMGQMTSQILDDVRRISAELRPGVLDHLGLVAAFEWLAQEFAERTGTRCDVVSNLAEAPLDRDVSTALFRIVQEALTNVARHARAKHVEVRLERVGAELRLEVKDDGVGIPPARARGVRSLGLLGMRERARRLGGSAMIDRVAEGGTRLIVVLPVAPAPVEAAP